MWSKRVTAGAEIAGTAHTHIPFHIGAAFAAAALCTAAGAAQAEPLYDTVVVAEPAVDNRARQDDAASSSVVTATRTPRSAEDLPQLLSELPGVSVTRLGGLGSFATLSLRGSSANQVEVYFDGVPLSAASGGGVDIGLIPVVDLESVEVYRGMSPIGFGTSAMGGIVSLSSASATDSGTRAYVGGGSFGTEFGGVQARWAGNKLRALASVNEFGSAGDFTYHNDNATSFTPGDDSISRRENNALQQMDGLVHVVGLLPERRQIWAQPASFSEIRACHPRARCKRTEHRSAPTGCSPRLPTRRVTTSAQAAACAPSSTPSPPGSASTIRTAICRAACPRRRGISRPAPASRSPARSQ